MSYTLNSIGKYGIICYTHAFKKGKEKKLKFHLKWEDSITINQNKKIALLPPPSHNCKAKVSLNKTSCPKVAVALLKIYEIRLQIT